MITPDALQSAPDRWEGSEEAHQPRVVGIALLRIVPTMGVEAEEQLNVLNAVSAGWGFGLKHRNLLTQVAYVREHQISPRKKSRNSTG
jgi:hypothetical protein